MEGEAAEALLQRLLQLRGEGAALLEQDLAASEAAALEVDAIEREGLGDSPEARAEALTALTELYPRLGILERISTVVLRANPEQAGDGDGAAAAGDTPASPRPVDWAALLESEALQSAIQPVLAAADATHIALAVGGNRNSIMVVSTLSRTATVLEVDGEPAGAAPEVAESSLADGSRVVQLALLPAPGQLIVGARVLPLHSAGTSSFAVDAQSLDVGGREVLVATRLPSPAGEGGDVLAEVPDSAVAAGPEGSVLLSVPLGQLYSSPASSSAAYVVEVLSQPEAAAGAGGAGEAGDGAAPADGQASSLAVATRVLLRVARDDGGALTSVVDTDPLGAAAHRLAAVLPTEPAVAPRGIAGQLQVLSGQAAALQAVPPELTPLVAPVHYEGGDPSIPVPGAMRLPILLGAAAAGSSEGAAAGG